MTLKELRSMLNDFNEKLRTLEAIEMELPVDRERLHRAFYEVDDAHGPLASEASMALADLLDIAEAASDVTLPGHTSESYQAAMKKLIVALTKLDAGPLGENK